MDLDLLSSVVEAALKAGADAAEAVGAVRGSLSVSVRQGALEEVEREESRDLGLRVFVGKSQAVVSGSDLSAEARAKLVERAVAMARLSPEDIYAGFAPQERLYRGGADALDLFDPAEPDARALEDQARAVEGFALSIEGVSNSDGGSASWSRGGWAMVTSDGFAGAHEASAFSLSASVIAGEGSGMERGGEGRSTRHLADLPTAESIGLEAGRRAVARLSPRKIESRTAPVIIENRIATGLLGPLIGAVSATAVARGVSFLKDHLEKPVFGPGVRLIDEPLRKRGLGSTPFDDEGVATADFTLIDKGVLTSWLSNAASARQIGCPLTGHASRGLAGAPGVSPHNLTLAAGDAGLAETLNTLGSGLLVTSMFGPSLNPNTGDWSAGVAGFCFEGGEIAYPVNEITIAGNLIDLYARLVPLSDLEYRGSANAPSLFIDAMAIAGR